MCGASGSSQERQLLSAREEDVPVCPGCESLTSSPSNSASLLPQHSQLFNANTCPDNRSENKPSHVKVVSKRDSGKTSHFFVVFVFLRLQIYGMCLRVFLLLVKTRFVEVFVSYLLFIFLIRDIKLKENGQAVGCARLLIGLLGSFSQLVSCVLAIFCEMNFAHNWQVQKIPSLAQAISTSTIWKKTLKCKYSVWITVYLNSHLLRILNNVT